MEQQMVELLKTLNGLLKSGEPWPETGQMLLDALAVYWLSTGIAGVVAVVVSLFSAYCGSLLWRKAAELIDGPHDGAVFPCLLGGAFVMIAAGIGAVAGIIVAAGGLAGWVSPLGKLLADKL